MSEEQSELEHELYDIPRLISFEKGIYTIGIMSSFDNGIFAMADEFGDIKEIVRGKPTNILWKYSHDQIVDCLRHYDETDENTIVIDEIEGVDKKGFHYNIKNEGLGFLLNEEIIMYHHDPENKIMITVPSYLRNVVEKNGKEYKKEIKNNTYLQGLL